MKRLKFIGTLFLIATLGAITQLNILPNGFYLSGGMLDDNLLKNRSAHPRESDFDQNVTLEAMLAPGDDRGRWSETTAARIEGYVAGVRNGPMEPVNSFSRLHRDTHIGLALRPDAPDLERVEVEVTPRIRAWAEEQGLDWSTTALKRDLLGHRVQIEGWLFFDQGNAVQAENTNKGGERNWRATAWEIHPVTSIKVIR